jgi:hypothetical protein
MKKGKININELKRRLEEARGLQRRIRSEIDELREQLINAGVNPDAPKIDLAKRNSRIHKKWKQGKTFTSLGKEFNLSPTRISSICNRIDHNLNSRNNYRRN